MTCGVCCGVWVWRMWHGVWCMTCGAWRVVHDVYLKANDNDSWGIITELSIFNIWLFCFLPQSFQTVVPELNFVRVSAPHFHLYMLAQHDPSSTSPLYRTPLDSWRGDSTRSLGAAPDNIWLALLCWCLSLGWSLVDCIVNVLLVLLKVWWWEEGQSYLYQWTHLLQGRHHWFTIWY